MNLNNSYINIQNMNCIFITVFNNENYIKLLYILLESLYIYGNINDDIEILIYTSSHFMDIIKQSHLYSTNIQFEINDNYNNINLACKSRLDFFTLKSSIKYNKILYLDTDIIVKDDISKIFNLIELDVIYGVNEGFINCNTNYWGNNLFGDESNNYEDKTAFSSGILLFNNCEKIANLFEKIREHMNTDINNHFYDQPYIVYNAFKYNLYENKKMERYCVNNDYNTDSDKIIHHFAGNPGNYEFKVDRMLSFLQNLKDNTINENIVKTKDYINNNLLPIIIKSNENLEGNIFMAHNTTNYTDVFKNKTKNISSLVLNKQIKQVMEIGFNSGFSTLLMLITNPTITITCFDLGQHKYTLPCYEHIKKTFGDRVNIIVGDSTLTLPYVKGLFDLIHIDGGHSDEVARNDIEHSYRLSKNGTILIMDDYDFPNLKKLWDESIVIYSLKDLHISIYDSPHHNIKYV
jgi:predicted O-methyltransferase YrrM